MKAISVRAPWWWAILYAGKDIENRDWPTKYRGRVLLHASKWWNLSGVTDDVETVSHIYRQSGGDPCDTGLTYRMMKDMGGCIVGSVEIVDCVDRSDSPWFFGRYGFVLRNPITFPDPIPCKGALGFFEPGVVVPAQGMEAEGRNAKTGSVRKDESRVAEGDAP